MIKKKTINKNRQVWYSSKKPKSIQLEIPFEEDIKADVTPKGYGPSEETIPSKKEWKFVYDFILEELEEYREACENGDIVEVLDALCDIAYVSIGNGVMLHGLKDKIWPAYLEVQASNMSKACKTEKEAIETCVREADRVGEDTHWDKVGDYYIVYRTRDRKVLKSIKYFRPDLKQFFTEEELNNI